MLDAVCNAITAPINVDISATIGMELIPISSISLNTLLRKILNFSGLEKTTDNIRTYLPMFEMTFIGTKLHVIFNHQHSRAENFLPFTC